MQIYLPFRMRMILCAALPSQNLGRPLFRGLSI
jgi:hypothetical protein